MSRRLRLTTAARQDIREILDRSFSDFGSAQAEAYNARIKRTLASLREPGIPMSIRAWDNLTTGLRSCRVGGGGARHLVFFKIDNEVVRVVRVLHEAMDFARHIGGDANKD